MLMRSQGRIDLVTFTGFVVHTQVRGYSAMPCGRPACMIIRGCTNGTSGRYRASMSPHTLKAKILFSTVWMYPPAVVVAMPTRLVIGNGD
jgi:hypothetical protein